MNQRDLEQLSSYLDGQLNPSDSSRLEARLKREPELVSVLDDLRAARGLLRQLPQRRAPRNFTLTRKMVGINPPLPRSYPAFRFVTAIATLLFFFTFGLNTLAPQFAAQAPNFGYGGGGGPEAESELFSQQAPSLAEAPVTEAPAATEAPLAGAADLAPQPTVIPPAEESARAADTPVAKSGETGNTVDSILPQPTPVSAPFIPSVWQIAFALIAILGAVFMVLIRQSSARRWK